MLPIVDATLPGIVSVEMETKNSRLEESCQQVSDKKRDPAERGLQE
jgi:hypothetical protein